ncbi:hypothetical protein [Roseivirga seohaensis]|uniref:hypothetical protein n=1 Tax=Roseivirga seohaensis TaxID=1914963 RepID=UPI003BAC8621
MKKPNNDFTAEIIAECQMIKQFIANDYLPDLIRKTDPESAIRWTIVNLLDHKRNMSYKMLHTQQQCDNIALALLAMLLEKTAKYRNQAFELFAQERQRQITRGYTIARDIATYKSNELSNFALYRLTDDKRFYPFSNDSMLNEKQNHSQSERIIQAGAILLAHRQKECGQVQKAEFLKTASREETSLNPNQRKEVSHVH